MLPILNQSIWRDEAFTLLLSEKSPLEIIKITIQDTSPPLHYLILHYWMIIFGNSEVSSRGLSFLFHFLTTLTVFFIARKLVKNTAIQILISLTVLFNPFLLQYAFEARSYSLLAFLTTLAVYFALSKRSLLAGLVITLAIFTHNFAIFSFIAFLVWFIYAHEHTIRTEIGKFLKFAILPSIAILSWGSIIYTQWTKVATDFWIKQTTSSTFIHSFEQFTRGDIYYPTQPMLYTITLILCLFAFSYWVWKHKEEEGEALSLIFFVAVIPLLVTYIISALFAPIYHERYLIGTTPMLAIFVGWSLYKLYINNKKVRNLLIGFVGIYLVLLIQSSEQIVSTTTKPAINYSVNQVLSKAIDGDIIIPEDQLNFLEVKYYVKRSGSTIPVYAYNSGGKIPFYLGAVLFEPQEIMRRYPENNKVWQIKADGGYNLINQ